MPLNFSIRPATTNDASEYVYIETDAYASEFLESPNTFFTKLRTFPLGCKIADVTGQSVAYLICHPWTYANPPKLNSDEFILPPSPDVFFIHSVTVRRAYQKRGIGSALAKEAIAIGQKHGFSLFTLISVQYSIYFWKTLGFKQVESLPQSIHQALANYGDSAAFMAGHFP
jgi:ribosomal protein S18 acetylase RimI-like enzyme